MPEFNIILLGLEDSCKFLAKVDLLGRRGVVFRDDVRVARNGVDDDGRVVRAGPPYFHGLGAVVNNYHLLEIYLAFEVFAALQDVSAHFLVLLHL